MIDPSDQDWERLSAYLDGELPETERRAFARRMACEPELAAAAVELRAQSDSLRRIYPVARAVRPAWIRPAAWSGALAAALAIATFFAIPDAAPTDLGSIHATFLEQRFPSATQSPTKADFAQGGLLPDLSPVGLTLVAVREVKGGAAGHYAGRNACRLTLLSVTDAAAEDINAPDVWAVHGQLYAVKAAGMDADRLAAIEAYLKAVKDPAKDRPDRMAFARQVLKTRTCA
ncbi:hypothetical protein MLD63_06690 [Paracoccus sp. TK19116]|uniref:Putative zinc-finger domain-containing protein n=1 Tax=Paracoccus albicereus TaxID=2922394 RepID=A0ABT1MP93_9RHOB|nr:zf-HC2 domain-containing protein [Paracoccus albicereus]MCQ0970112.1 hypothetical protein [Paracoccus albicereus]